MLRRIFLLSAALVVAVAGGVRPAAAQDAPAAGAQPAAAKGSILASEETNWPGVVLEVTEFRRKGNTLTAKVRLRNDGAEKMGAQVVYTDVYVMDAAAGKKYEVLKDEKGSYIAALNVGWQDRWSDDLEPGQQATLWAKFPAPPAEVTSLTLQIPGAPPLEDLPIQDS